jgi:threonine/homoserine/homoserine lactone efflux protein
VPSGGNLITFAAAAFVLILVPGPSVLFTVSRGVALGRRAALVTVLGNSTGVYLQVIAVAVGLGALVERSVTLFTTVKLAGAAYLVLLGLRAIRSREELAAAFDATAAARSRRRIYWEGFIVGATNPKAIVFFAAILPQFVQVGHGPAALQMLVLGLIFVAIALVSDGTWGLAAGTARAWLARSPRRLRQLSSVGGLAMIGLGLRLAATGRGD